MKNIFEKLESEHQPDWDKAANWDKINKKFPKRKGMGLVLFFMKSAAAILILMSGWIWGILKIESSEQTQIVEVKEIQIYDTLRIVETKWDTLILEKKTSIAQNQKPIQILPFKTDTVYIEIAHTDVPENVNKPKTDSLLIAETQSQKSIYITNYAENVEIGEVQSRTTTKFSLFNRVFSPSTAPKRDFLIAINK